MIIVSQKFFHLSPQKNFILPIQREKKPQNKISLCATIHNFWKNKWFSKWVTINFSRKFTPLRSQQTRIEAELRPRSMFYLNLMNMVGWRRCHDKPLKDKLLKDKLLTRQTPERQTPEIMKFFSEWNMIKFINLRRKNPQIS